MTLAPLREAADSLQKASTPQPFSTSKTSNWVARLGGLPDYIQHVAHGILRSDPAGGVSGAIQKAVGVVKNWAAGQGKTDATTKAAAAKAVAEWEALKAKNAAKGAARESWIEEADHYYGTLSDERLAERDAMGRIVVYEREYGVDGMIALMGPALLEAAQAWKPTLKPALKAPNESERHDVFDGAQKVGSVACEPGYSAKEPPRWRAKAVNGDRVGGYGLKSKNDALDALNTHLGQAPARVISMPTSGQYFVATPSSYGDTSYKAFPNEVTARHAAGLPASPTVPEMNSTIDAVSEALRFDLMTVSGMDLPPLRRVQEARRTGPFDLIATEQLGEAFHFDPSEPRNFRGRWENGGRGLLKDRPDIALDKLPDSVGSGSWDKGAERATRDMLAGKVEDTEHAHRAVNPDGSLGVYSAQREKLHQEILDRLFQGKLPHPDTARAIFTAGGPASGKSAMIRDGGVDVPKDVVHVNADVVREMLPEYKALKAAGRQDASALTHEEASHVSKLAMRVALAHRYHVLVDTVGNSGPGNFASKIKAAQDAGHAVSVHYATVPTEEALRRANARGRKTGRYVPESYLRSAHKAVSERFVNDIQHLPHVHLQVFDTSSAPAKVIAEKKAGSDSMAIADRRAYRQFLGKAKA